MIIREGVLNFIEPEAVKVFFQKIAEKFPTQTQIIFDYVHPLIVRIANKSNYVRRLPVGIVTDAFGGLFSVVVG